MDLTEEQKARRAKIEALRRKRKLR